MNFINKQHIVRLEISQDSGKIARLFQHWPRRLAQASSHLVSQNVCQGRFTQTWRTKHQNVI